MAPIGGLILNKTGLVDPTFVDIIAGRFAEKAEPPIEAGDLLNFLSGIKAIRLMREVMAQTSSDSMGL
jgi:hypothetical protein